MVGVNATCKSSKANHSVEALVVFEKKFNASITIELVCFAGFACGIYTNQNLDVFALLLLYSLYQFIKGFWYFLLFRDYFTLKITADWNYYKISFPFFLLSILGFLASKVDVYLINHLGDKITTANYQVINSLLVFTIPPAPIMFWFY